ncbi:MAG: DUF4383 domain-containing protein [Chloroflexota bacterium]|nr:DUF4383 domain-containing protein [Chloroflexota bacterium]
MPFIRLLALVLGVVYTLVGIAGFIPPLLARIAAGVTGPFAGNLLGIFAVNWFHSLAHLLIGLAGLAAYRSYSASRTYSLVIGLAYALLFVLGLLSRPVGTLGGLLPLNSADDILHIATAAVLLVAYFAAGSRGEVTAGR